MGKRLLICLAFFVLPASAQQAVPSSDSAADTSAAEPATQSPDIDAKDLFHDFFVDEYRMWTSPFRINDYDSHTMVKYGLPFLAASAAMIATDRNTTGAIPDQQGDARKPFERDRIIEP